MYWYVYNSLGSVNKRKYEKGIISSFVKEHLKRWPVIIVYPNVNDREYTKNRELLRM